MKKFLHKIIVLSVVAIAMMMWTHRAQAQTTVHLYLDSVAPWSTHHFCKDAVDTVVIHKLSGTTINYWNCAIPPYDFYQDTLVIPNTYNSLPGGHMGDVGYYHSTGDFAIYILFDDTVSSPGLIDQVICGNTPLLLDASNATAYAQYLWSTGESTQTISTNQTGLYWVIVSSACNVVTDTFHLTFVHIDGEGCAASFDPITQKNKVLWDGSNPHGDQMIIYKRNISNILVPVDTVSFALGEWIDYNSNPQYEESGYALVPKDTCGGLGNMSDEMITIWLQISQYQGDVYFQYTLGMPIQATYQLNGIRLNNQIDSITSRPAAFQNILLPDSIASQYVKFYISYTITCGGAKSLVEIRSNIVDGVTGIEELSPKQIHIYPNPVTDILFIETEHDIQQLFLYNNTGKLVYQGKNMAIDFRNMTSGIYLLRVQTDGGGMFSSLLMKQ